MVVDGCYTRVCRLPSYWCDALLARGVDSRSGVKLGFALWIVSLVGCAAIAGEVNSIQVIRQDEIYRVEINALINVPPDVVRSLLTDYKNLTRISPAVLESTVLSVRAKRIHRVYTITRLCILIYCTDLKQIQDMEQLPNGDLTATIVPGEGHFKRGTATWQLTDEQKSTRLLFQAGLVPNFWMPPIIGPWLIRQLLYREAVQTVQGLERLYHER